MSDRVSLEFLGRQMQAIQAKLREIEIGIQVERSRVDGFVQVMGHQLGEVEASVTMRLGALETLINDRFDHLVELIGQTHRKD
jgi:hypothetical protein